MYDDNQKPILTCWIRAMEPAMGTTLMQTHDEKKLIYSVI